MYTWQYTSYALFSVVVLSIQIQAQPTTDFIQVEGRQFRYQSAPYTYIGTNLWYAAHLAATTAGKERLVMELDKLKEVGVDNLRIMACGEGPESEPYRITPTLQPSPGAYRDDMLVGLDFALAEMGKHQMHAVLCLTNFFQWSGGMSQYVSWATGSPIPYPETHSWDDFQSFTAQFYKTPKAKRLFRQHVKSLLQRKNTITGVLYRDDPTIMSWQLANEPREFGNDPAYYRWVKQSSRMVSRKAKNHLVSIGNEGQIDQLVGSTYHKTAAYKHIDYLTVHMWPENWGWFNPKEASATMDSTLVKAQAYLYRNAQIAAAAGKPIVLEEFGIARDNGQFSPESATTVRDSFYQFIFNQTLAGTPPPYQGINFWSWSGTAHPVQPGLPWQKGQPFTGDPPHEPQGWYGVFATDQSTLQLIRQLTAQINADPASNNH